MKTEDQIRDLILGMHGEITELLRHRCSGDYALMWTGIEKRWHQIEILEWVLGYKVITEDMRI